MNHNKHLPSLLLALAGLWILPAGFPGIAPAQAQERIQDEAARSDFIYRVNLGRADDVRLLMRQGASPNQVSGTNIPVICLAAGRIDPEGVNVVQALLEAGANLEARDPKGQSALFYAAKAGNIPTINYLLEQRIDAYALDNNGDVARTAAFKAGQPNAVKAIDDFALRQTAELTQAYRQRNQELSNPQPASPAPQAANVPPQAEILPVVKPEPGIAAPAPPAPPAPTPDITSPGFVPPEAPDAPPAPAMADDDEAAADESNETPVERSERMKEESRNLIYSMSFNVCAFQYWSYCSSAKQSVDLDKEELIVAIESSKSAALSLKRQLIKEYSIPAKTVESISTSAQRRIYKEINSMPSNRERHEQGVGKRDDMQDRCESIARQWGVKPPKKLVDPAPPPESGTGKGGKRGGKGLGSGSAGRRNKSSIPTPHPQGSRRGATQQPTPAAPAPTFNAL